MDIEVRYFVGKRTAETMTKRDAAIHTAGGLADQDLWRVRDLHLEGVPEPHLDRAIALGADHGVLDTGEDWSRQVRGFTGKRGVDVCADSVGEAMPRKMDPSTRITSRPGSATDQRELIILTRSTVSPGGRFGPSEGLRAQRIPM